MRVSTLLVALLCLALTPVVAAARDAVTEPLQRLEAQPPAPPAPTAALATTTSSTRTDPAE